MSRTAFRKCKSDLPRVIITRVGDSLLPSGIATFLNPYSYLRLRGQGDLLEAFDRIYFDGSLMVRLARLFGIKSSRKSFDYTSIAQEVFEEAASVGGTLAIVGGSEGVALSASLLFAERAPGLKLGRVSSGFFESGNSRKALISKLVNEDPAYVLVGMGTPLQEAFLRDLKDAGWSGIGYTCGGFLHQTVDADGEYYPDWINRLNLRWAYRMAKEPSTRKRYLFTYPRAVLLILHDAIRFRFHR